jgi:endoglucanase
VVRAAIGIEYGGYLQHPDKEKEKIDSVVEAAIDLGIYVIIDWHSHNAQKEAGAAVQFFSAMAKTYGNHPNVIYEIFNEPMIISWDTVIKPYSENLIHAIRRYDPDNIIIVGTPSWSQDVDIAARNPINDTNIAYALHFYAGTHRQWLRDKADTALKKGLALWVTEFGTCKADGKGDIYPDELNEWFDYMDRHKISWCNWSVADKKETASILKPRADKNGNWPESKLTKSGILIRNKLRGKNL